MWLPFVGSMAAAAAWVVLVIFVAWTGLGAA